MLDDLSNIDASLLSTLEVAISLIMRDGVSRVDAEWIATQIIGNRFMQCYLLYKDRLIQSLPAHEPRVEP